MTSVIFHNIFRNFLLSCRIVKGTVIQSVVILDDEKHYQKHNRTHTETEFMSKNHVLCEFLLIPSPPLPSSPPLPPSLIQISGNFLLKFRFDAAVLPLIVVLLDCTACGTEGTAHSLAGPATELSARRRSENFQK